MTTKIDDAMLASTKPRPSRRRFWLTGLLLVAIACICGVWIGGAWQPPPPDEVLQIAVGDEGKTMTVDVFRPRSEERPQRTSAILMLPGVEGAKHGAFMHYPRARQLADDGHTVYVLHYLEPCGYDHIYFQKEDESLDTDKIDEFIARDSNKWIGGVTDVLAEVARQPDIDPRRIGILGYSLGCFVEISVADDANKDDATPNLAALVGNWGAKFEGVEFDASFPPSRFYHGKEDKIVLVAWAKQTVAELQAVHVNARLTVFPGEEHIVENPLAWAAARAFFRKLLSPTGGPSGGAVPIPHSITPTIDETPIAAAHD